MSNTLDKTLESMMKSIFKEGLAKESVIEEVKLSIDTINSMTDNKERTICLINLIGFIRQHETLGNDDKEVLDMKCALAFPDPNIVIDDKSGLTIFLYFVKEANELVAGVLIQNGADILKTDKLGLSCAYHAVMGRNLNLITMFSDKGANLHAVNANNESLLHAACANGDEDIVAFLLAKDLDPNITENRYNLNCLGTAAAFSDSPRVLKMLQDKGAEYTQMGKDNLTPFELALQESHSLSIAYFIDTKQADDNIVDTKNISTLLDSTLFDMPKKGRLSEEEMVELKAKQRIKNFALYTIERNLSVDDCINAANSADHMQVICRQFHKTPLDLLDMNLDDEKATLVRIALMT